MSVSSTAKGMGIERVAVLGAGTMGSRIAAHIANAGVPVVLLDIAAPGVAKGAPRAERNKLVAGALEALKKSRPPALFATDTARLVSTGNFEDDMELVADCDWIIEVVAENLEIKRALLTRLLACRKPGTITTTNTSGIPIATIVEGLDASGDLSKHWFGTHFFNPPRHMRLLEIIPTASADPEDISRIAAFCDQRLGKAIVQSRDTPNFIANRIGVFSMGNAIRLKEKQGLSVEEVDALTGSPLGWPKTGTFRLTDLVGVDVVSHVSANFRAQTAGTHPENQELALPPVFGKMLERKWVGDKAGQGFYKKAGRDAEGRDLRQVLDWQTLEYHPEIKPDFPALQQTRSVESAAARIRQLMHADTAEDRAARFYWSFLSELFTYSANRVSGGDSEPAADVVAVDQAMKNGFNWELGPFEMMDAAGVRETAEKMRKAGQAVSANVDALLESGADSWYREDPAGSAGHQFFDVVRGEWKPVPVAAGVRSFATAKKAKPIVRGNGSASLIDLGDGVGGIELHSKMNALGRETVTFFLETLNADSQAVAEFSSFVVSGDSTNFSVGANLAELMKVVQAGEWDQLDSFVRDFQGMTQAVKFCPRPVVAAPFGMCLGGGAEVALHAAARQPHAELYMGLVEAGVGLLPGGGGCKEMVLRAIDGVQSLRPDARAEGVEIFAAVQKAFDTIAKGTVSTSAAEARELGFLQRSDLITMNRGRVLADAVTRAAALAAAGYRAPTPRKDIPAPGTNVLATLKLAIWTFRQGEYISEHDATVATSIAHALCGGSVTPGTPVSETYLLDLEREGFLSLCGEAKTQERIAYTLKTGKPLRN